MTAFDFSETPNYVASETLSMQDLNGLLRAHLSQQHLAQRLGSLPSICFTAIDQAFLVWGVLTLVIFSFAQFSSLSWTTQAILDAALTGTGIATTSGLTWILASSEKLRWVIFLWAGLMTAGTLATVYGIFYGSAFILSNLCLLWLGLCCIGYGAMGLWMQSRSFSAACLMHLIAIVGLEQLSGWQFFGSGLVMATTLFFFSVVPWDMQASEHDIPC
ncbi:MAG: hypothetical protein AAFO84_00010 [Cyanobacteria bacterium J06598_1]